MLERRGLRAHERSAAGAALSWPDAAPSTRRFGGNVQLIVEHDSVFLVLNGVVGPRRFVEDIVGELVARGLDVRFEDA